MMAKRDETVNFKPFSIAYGVARGSNARALTLFKPLFFSGFSLMTTAFKGARLFVRSLEALHNHTGIRE